MGNPPTHLCVFSDPRAVPNAYLIRRGFCIAISGYKPGGDICEKIFTPSYSTPTLHILGKTDVVVVEERSMQLIAVSSDKRVEQHTGG